MTLSDLRSVPLFRTLEDGAAHALCDLLTTRELETGEAVFHYGDPGDAMFFVESGCVRISVKDADGNEAVLAELGRGEFFGEMAILDSQPRSADATAMRPTQLGVLSRGDFHALICQTPSVALGILAALTHRLRRTDNLLRHRVSRNANEEEAARLTLADRAADTIAEFGGSWKFISASVGFTIFWIALNSWILTHPFDVFPYVLLNLVLGIIAGLQAPIILMAQNRQSEKDRLRAELDYRVNLKNELVLTEILHRLQAIEHATHRSAGRDLPTGPEEEYLPAETR